jgi:hypothetical protein
VQQARSELQDAEQALGDAVTVARAQQGQQPKVKDAVAKNVQLKAEATTRAKELQALNQMLGGACPLPRAPSSPPGMLGTCFVADVESGNDIETWTLGQPP